MRSIRDGTATLTCHLACAGSYGLRRSTYAKDDAAGDWLDLGLGVAGTGYELDQAYYYLGRAAEGMGAPAAAIRYYSQAAAIASRPGSHRTCAGVLDVCDGIRLPDAAMDRLRVLQAYPGVPTVAGGSAGDLGVDHSALPLPAAALHVVEADVAARSVATLTCDITRDGLTENCRLLALQGSADFGRGVLSYVRKARFRPAVRNGMPVDEPGHRFTIGVRPGPA